MADERAKALKNQFIMDMHTHFLRDDTPHQDVRRPARDGRQARLEPGPRRARNRRSTTSSSRTTSRRSSSTATPRSRASAARTRSTRQYSFLTNDMKYAAREKVNKEVGHEAHVLARDLHRRAATAGSTRWRKRRRSSSPTRGRATRSATTPTSTSRSGRSGSTTRRSCIRSTRSSSSGARRARPRSTSASTRGSSRRRSRRSSRTCSRTRTCATWARPRRTGRSSTSSSTTRAGAGPGPTRRRTRGSISRRPAASSGSPTSPRFPEKYGVKNVYGDLGQLFAWTTTANPRLGAAVMGTLVEGPGRRPRRVGHRRRVDRLAAVADRGAAPARDPGRHAEEVRLQAARRRPTARSRPRSSAATTRGSTGSSPKQQAEVLTDRIAQIKETYEKHGADRSNLAYGYIAKPTA